MEHPLEREFGLSAYELLDALQARFRARVALEGAVAEVQMEQKLRPLVGTVIERYEVYDIDGHPDFGIWLPGSDRRLLAECKNVRENRQGTEAYREGGKVVAYKVETQKTRASKGDPMSRFYDVDQFDIPGGVLGEEDRQLDGFRVCPRGRSCPAFRAQRQAGRVPTGAPAGRGGSALV